MPRACVLRRESAHILLVLRSSKVRTRSRLQTCGRPRQFRSPADIEWAERSEQSQVCAPSRSRTFAVPHWVFETWRTTPRDHCSRAEDSGHVYTLMCDKPVLLGITRTVLRSELKSGPRNRCGSSPQTERNGYATQPTGSLRARSLDAMILVSGCNRCSVEAIEDQNLVVAATVVDTMNLDLIVGDQERDHRSSTEPDHSHSGREVIPSTASDGEVCQILAIVINREQEPLCDFRSSFARDSVIDCAQLFVSAR